MRNHAVGVDSAGERIVQRNGIAQGISKDALALVQGRHDAEAREARSQARALPVNKKESLVLLNRSTQREAILIPAELGRADFLKK